MELVNLHYSTIGICQEESNGRNLKMRKEQWDLLKKCARMGKTDIPPVGMIVDSPWIPGYCGISTLDYLTIPEKWWDANLKIRRDFPEVLFVPDFWVEYGMAAEASGFGCKVKFYEHKTPEISHIIDSADDLDTIADIKAPDPRTDGLMPIILNIYKNVKPKAEDIGEPVRMVAARGPLTIAAHIMGVTEFLVAVKTDPDNAHKLLKTTAALTKSWLEAQADTLKNIEGIMVLDDIVGFLSREDYLEFAHPYLKDIFGSFPSCVRFYHNDNDNPVCYSYLEELKVDIFNFSYLQDIVKVRGLAGDKVCLFGNLPPVEVLTQGTPELVRDETLKLIEKCGNMNGVILSAGGGASPGMPGINLKTIVDTVKNGK